MKILLVSMNSIHFTRWSEQLRESGHEVYWFDILDQGYASSLSWTHQITGWKKGFLKKKGRSFVKQQFPRLFTFLSSKLDVAVETAFESAVVKIKPDVVHSFALYVSCAPILSVMNKFKDLKWVYSSWGSDLFYFKNDARYLKEIKAVLPRLDYMFADCKRDQFIANQLGFKGRHLGVFPGGGGFDLNFFAKNTTPFHERSIILIKGNHNRSGRSLTVLKALDRIPQYLEHFKVIVFNADNPLVLDFKNSNIPNIEILKAVDHKKLLKLFCKSKIYIGNSNSDGTPNTLLEAICSGVFPIQSNPGGATEEIINETNKNGLLIKDCEDVTHITQLIIKALTDQEFTNEAVRFNNEHISPSLDRTKIINQVLNCYNSIYI